MVIKWLVFIVISGRHAVSVDIDPRNVLICHLPQDWTCRPWTHISVRHHLWSIKVIFSLEATYFEYMLT